MEWVRAAALLVAAGAFAAAALSLGGAFSDRLDLLTHFTPFWLGGAALGLLLALLGRSGWPVNGLALTAMTICAGLMAPEWLARPAGAAPVGASPSSLKLVQFNLWSRNADPAATAAWIAAERPDIVTVEEASEAGAAVARALAPSYPYRVSSSSVSSEGSTLILSKAPPSAGGRLFSRRIERFAGAWACYGEGAEAFSVVAVHYAWPTPAGRQQAQSRAVAAFLETLPKPSLIVAGDFNATPWSFALRRQDARFGLARLTRALFTWPTRRFRRRGVSSPMAFLPIDHVYAGTDWRAASVCLGPVLGSDHRPVVVVLERAASAASVAARK